ncbi:Uncharacterised protein [uncultured archaeon]|nr:Uncharacterised protein [uncultured archaeon]
MPPSKLSAKHPERTIPPFATALIVGLLLAAGGSGAQAKASGQGSSALGFGYGPLNGTITSVTGPSFLRTGETLLVNVAATQDDTPVQIRFYLPAGGLAGNPPVETVSLNTSSTLSYTGDNFTSAGTWTMELDDGAKNITHEFTIIEDYYMRILLLETNPDGAARTITINTNDTWNVAAGFPVGGENTTLSGTLHNGSISEASFGCDLDGDGETTGTLYVWVGDPTAPGEYNKAYFDNDPILNETSDATTKLRRTIDDTAVRCQNLNETAPYRIAHIWNNGVVLAMPPGPGDRPYTTGDNITLAVFTQSGAPTSTNITSLILRLQQPNGSYQETDVKNDTHIEDQTGADGLSNEAVLQTGTYAAGSYTLIANNLAAETFNLQPSWNAMLLVGDPLMRRDRFDFQINSPLAAGLTTDADNITTITFDIYNPSSILTQTWTYNGTDADGLFWSNSTNQYIIGLTTNLTPLFSLNSTGRWDVVVTLVNDGVEERVIGRSITVKSFELQMQPIRFLPGNPEPDFGAFPPNAEGFITLLATNFGVKGDIAKNLDPQDLLPIDENVSDDVNVCNQSLISLEITDSSGTLLANYSSAPGIIGGFDNVKQTVDSKAPTALIPQPFESQCMAWLPWAPATPGEYALHATLNLNGETTEARSKLLIQNLETYAQPWDLTSNTFRPQFPPSSNVTLKITVKDLQTGNEVSPENIQNIEPQELFAQGTNILDAVTAWGWQTTTIGQENTTILWIQLPNTTTSFHSLRYRITTTINSTPTTGIGGGGFEIKRYDIRGYPNSNAGFDYFAPGDSINLTIEVRGPRGPASNVDVYIQEIRHQRTSRTFNYTAIRATTGSDGRANVTIDPTENLTVGEYDVSIRVRDADGNIDYGRGFFKIQDFYLTVFAVERTGGNCTPLNAGGKDGGGGPIKVVGSQAFAIVGFEAGGGIVQATPRLDQSQLFQFTNLNGEPVFRSLTPNITNVAWCLIPQYGNVNVSSFILQAASLGGEYDIEAVGEDAQGRMASGFNHFSVSPFNIDVEFLLRGEPVFSPGESLRFRVSADPSSNVTDASLVRLLKMGGGGKEGDQTIPHPENIINLTWENDVNASRVLTATLSNAGLNKGEYVLQLRFNVTFGDGQPGNVIYSQWFSLRSFTYGLANILQTWSQDYNTTSSYKLYYYDEQRGNRFYDQYPGGCPYPVISSNYSCGLINKTGVRAEILQVRNHDEEVALNQFYSYYNTSGNLTVLRGFNLIVGPVSWESVSSARVYVAQNDADLTNGSLTPLSVGDTITDSSGAKFRISKIQRDSVTLAPVIFANTWELRDLRVNTSGNVTLSGVLRIGTIGEDFVDVDFNHDGEIDRGQNRASYGIPFVLMDPHTSGVYDTALVDTNLDLDFTAETPIIIGGNGANLNYAGKTLYLIKGDFFDVLFAFNESGRDNWLGTHRKQSNITIPIYSRTRNLNITVAEIVNDRTFQPLDPNNYTWWPAVVGDDGMGFLTVNIAVPGSFRVLYRATDPNGTITEVPEPWEAPFLQVRAFDSRTELFKNVIKIPAFTDFNATSCRLTWWESRGTQTEWINTNGTLLEQILADLPEANFTGYLSNDFGPSMIYDSYTALYNQNIQHLFIKAAAGNYSGAAAYSQGDVVLTRERQFPDGQIQDPQENITYTFKGIICRPDGCQTVFEAAQTNTAIITKGAGAATGCGGPTNGLYQVCYDTGIRREGVNTNAYMFINDTGGLPTNLYIDDDLNLSTAQKAVALDASGIPNETGVIQVRGDANTQDWCAQQGCPGGEAEVNLTIFNATWTGTMYQITFDLQTKYNDTIHSNIKVDPNQGALVGPSGSYLVTYASWRNLWYAIDTTNPADPVFYTSATSNFTGTSGKHQGEDIGVYNSWLNDTIILNVLYISPLDYGWTTFNLAEEKQYQAYLVTLSESNNTEQTARFLINETTCRGCGADEMWLNPGQPTQERRGVKITFGGVNGDNSVNASVTLTNGMVTLGYNVSGLPAETQDHYTNENYQKLLCKINVSGTLYNAVAIDGNESQSDVTLTSIYLSNDTILTPNEGRQYGNLTNFDGTNYYLSYLSQNDGVVIAQNPTKTLGIPRSVNGQYKRSIAPETAWPTPLNNNSGRNVTFILYAEERGQDEPAQQGMIRGDDDSNMIRFDRECEGGGEGMNCTDQNPTSGSQTDEAGLMAEAQGNIGTWNFMNLPYRNASGALFTQSGYEIWDANTSEPVHLLERYQGWWGQSLTTRSNLTVGIRVRDFNGQPISGTVNVTGISMFGVIGGRWQETDLANYSDINVSVHYDGITIDDNRLDSDGLMFLLIALTDNTSWYEGFGYEVRILIQEDAGDSEESSIWFDFRGKGGGGGGGEGPQVEACEGVANNTVCASNPPGLCSWNAGLSTCQPNPNPVYCRDLKNQSDCTNANPPCLWVTGTPEGDKCLSCNMIQDESSCSHLPECNWDADKNKCMRIAFSGGGGGNPDACNSIIVQNVCDNSHGLCAWDGGLSECNPTGDPVDCTTYATQGACNAADPPCFWDPGHNQCASCNIITQQSICDQTPGPGALCTWSFADNACDRDATGGGP